MAMALMLAVGMASAQSVKPHKVKKNETIYGIARDNGLSVDQLVAVNPGMERPDYVLKKGKVINIPILDQGAPASNRTDNGRDDVRQRAIRLGVMLPLNNQTGDGRRMIEYYRGVLMACESLKHDGLSVDVRAWNTPQDVNLASVLNDPSAAQCDIVLGPLYSRQMQQISDFADRHGIMVVIPFSIDAPQLYFNRQLFQVYQQPSELVETTARHFADWFKDHHPVIIDCADTESTKGPFTSALRRQLDLVGVRYSITSMQSTDAHFASAFSLQRPNVVVLNTSRVADMKNAFTKVGALLRSNPSLEVSFFGYEEWMGLAKDQATNFHRFDMYIPAPFFTNISGAETRQMEQQYKQNFGESMQSNCPRFALTGYDQAMFFLRGLHIYGTAFDGGPGRLAAYQSIQTPLKFERIGNGGLQNRAFMFIHYKTNGTIETINY